MKDSLGDRIKGYEKTTSPQLISKLPVIMRFDGRAFHTFTKGMSSPWDYRLHNCMAETSCDLLQEIQGSQLAYIQSDEISILLTDWTLFSTQGWFDYKVQKMCSVGASICTIEFNKYLQLFFAKTKFCDKRPTFDCRVFNLPLHEVTNYFIWRQQDATRNSIQSLAYANFSHKECMNLSCGELQDKLFKEKSINWNNLPVYLKRGFCSMKDKVDENVPIFSQNRDYIENFIPPLYFGEEK